MFLQTFEANNKGIDYVIGDLHGMYDLLFQTLKNTGFNDKTDRCFSVGDLIDRGPDSEKCLSLIHEPWFFPVRGNHEDILIEVARAPSSSRALSDWLLHGGRWHLQVSSEQMLEYANWIEVLPYIIKINSDPSVIICHAEYPLDSWQPETIENDHTLIREVQWSRRKIRTMDETVIKGIGHVICGHTIVKEPITLGNTHFIDTGAFQSKLLTLQPLSALG